MASVFLRNVLGPVESRMSPHAWNPTELIPVSIGVDINPRACAVALRTAAQNDRQIDIVQSDLLTSLKRVHGKVDILLFNPPYVPTDESE